MNRVRNVKLETVRLNEILKNIMKATNEHLTKKRQSTIRRLGGDHGHWVLHLLANSPVPQLKTLSLSVFCYARKKKRRDNEMTTPQYVRLDRPYFWVRLFKRYRPLYLCFEIVSENGQISSKAFLQEHPLTSQSRVSASNFTSDRKNQES